MYSIVPTSRVGAGFREADPRSASEADVDMGDAPECPDPISLPKVLDFHRCDPGPYQNIEYI